MRFTRVGEKNIEYYYILKSLNDLTQVSLYSNSLLLEKKFGCAILGECSRFWNDFSLDIKYEITLFSNGEPIDIELNGVIISPIIKGYESWTNSRGYANKFVIKGVSADKTPIEFQFPMIDNIGKLLNIIYGLIVISECKNIDDANKIWKLIMGATSILTIEDRLPLIMGCSKQIKNIVDTYPFMENIIKKGLDSHVAKAKEEISNLYFMKASI